MPQAEREWTSEGHKSTGKAFVCIVDDDPDFASYLRVLLSERGYEVRWYAKGDELLASINHSDAPEIVVLDLLMPGLDGLATLRAVKASRPHTPVIMLSGESQPSAIVEAARLGAADYVVKPAGVEGLDELGLEAAIETALERNRVPAALAEADRPAADDDGRSLWDHGEKMRAIAALVDRVADSDVTVLILGESGVGKALVARAIHQRSTRRDRPFVNVNCPALPGELLESELFGHERGAFTGAITARIGRFEQANRGTIL